MPAVVAEIATAIQDDSRGVQGRRRSVSQAARNTMQAQHHAAAHLHFQSGKLLIGSPGGYFSARCTESNRPQ